MGAKAIADVADRPRRRTWVGEPTVGTILGQRFAPRFLDWYLARTGYSGQQAAEKDASNPMLPDNVYAPAPGDHGARGIFSDRAHTTSPQVWLIGHRRLSAAIGGAVGALAAVVAVRSIAKR